MSLKTLSYLFVAFGGPVFPPGLVLLSCLPFRSSLVVLFVLLVVFAGVVCPSGLVGGPVCPSGLVGGPV